MVPGALLGGGAGRNHARNCKKSMMRLTPARTTFFRMVLLFGDAWLREDDDGPRHFTSSIRGGSIDWFRLARLVLRGLRHSFSEAWLPFLVHWSVYCHAKQISHRHPEARLWAWSANVFIQLLGCSPLVRRWSRGWLPGARPLQPQEIRRRSQVEARQSAAGPHRAHDHLHGRTDRARRASSLPRSTRTSPAKWSPAPSAAAGCAVASNSSAFRMHANGTARDPPK